MNFYKNFGEDGGCHYTCGTCPNGYLTEWDCLTCNPATFRTLTLSGKNVIENAVTKPGNECLCIFPYGHKEGEKICLLCHFSC